jgi:hypothetical protein
MNRAAPGPLLSRLYANRLVIRPLSVGALHLTHRSGSVAPSCTTSSPLRAKPPAEAGVAGAGGAIVGARCAVIAIAGSGASWRSPSSVVSDGGGAGFGCSLSTSVAPHPGQRARFPAADAGAFSFFPQAQLTAIGLSPTTIDHPWQTSEMGSVSYLDRCHHNRELSSMKPARL